MAAADYRLCDLCNGKAFYDANLNYDNNVNDKRQPFRLAGEHQIANPELRQRGYRLDYVGDWAVLCEDCAKTHQTQIVPKSK